MNNHSDYYLKETLFQAKKFGLDPTAIHKLETELYSRQERNKRLK